jgi:hypothetical protein
MVENNLKSFGLHPVVKLEDLNLTREKETRRLGVAADYPRMVNWSKECVGR